MISDFAREKAESSANGQFIIDIRLIWDIINKKKRNAVNDGTSKPKTPLKRKIAEAGSNLKADG